MISPILLICELDAQLLGDLPSLEQFGRWVMNHREQVRLVYMTALSTSAVRELVEMERVSPPDFVIACGGTEVDDFGAGISAEGWNTRIPSSWRADRIWEALASFPELELHPESMQSANKVSYYLDRATPRALLQIEIALANAGLEADVSYFKDQLLDVLPKGINKATAARFLHHLTGIPRSRTVVCGDSLSELGLYEHGYLGIVCASADLRLRTDAPPEAYRSERKFAAGLLDGLKYWLSEAGEYAGSPKTWKFFTALANCNERCGEQLSVVAPA